MIPGYSASGNSQSAIPRAGGGDPHPDEYGLPGDCFSSGDMQKLVQYNLQYLELSNGLGRYRVKYNGPKMTDKEMHDLYENARILMSMDFFNKAVIEYGQLEIMRKLAKTLKGLQFMELGENG